MKVLQIFTKIFLFTCFFSLCPSLVDAQLSDGLLLYYDLNGDYEDGSGNNFDGTGYNVEFTEDYLGQENSAIDANGVNTYVEFPDNPMLEPDFPITMAVRAKFDVLDGTQVVAATDFGVTTHSGAWIQVASNGQINASYGNAIGGFGSNARHGRWGDYELEVDTWYQIVAIFRGYNDISIYIDCTLTEGPYSGFAQSIGYTSATGSLCRKRANQDFVIPPYYFAGGVDEFYYWDRELTPDEVSMVCDEGFAFLNCDNTGDCYATSVEYVEGVSDDGGNIPVDRTDSFNSLGQPEETDQLVFTTLGYGGSLTFGFDGSVPNGPGDDIRVVETSYNTIGCEAYQEYADVEVSTDGVTWYYIGTVCKSDPYVDIDNAEIALDCVEYVRVVSNDALTSTSDAYDVDGIIALHNCVEPIVIDGIESTDFLTADLVVYPNPTATGITSIAYTSRSQDLAEVSIYDVHGRKVFQTRIADLEAGNNQLMQVDLSGSAKGIYICTIQQGEHLVTEKIVLR